MAGGSAPVKYKRSEIPRAYFLPVPLAHVCFSAFAVNAEAFAVNAEAVFHFFLQTNQSATSANGFVVNLMSSNMKHAKLQCSVIASFTDVVSSCSRKIAWFR